MRILCEWISCMSGPGMGNGKRETGNGERVSAPSVSRLPSPVSPLLIHPIIRGFLRDRHVVHVALADAGVRHAHEMRTAAHLLDRRATDVAHARAQAADELVHDALEGTAIRHAA